MDSNIKITDNGLFKTIQCADDEHYITDWQPTDDIRKFKSFRIAYIALDADTSKYHCISNEDNEALTTQFNETHEADIEAEYKARQEQQEAEYQARQEQYLKEHELSK